MHELVLHSLLASFEAAGPLPGKDKLAASVRVRRLREREAAFHANDACSHVFAVRDGILKQVYVREDGTERIKSFAGPGELFACPFALRPGGRTSFASVAIGPCTVESVDYRLLEALAASYPRWQAVLTEAFRRLAELKVERERDLLMLSAQELYRDLAERRPALLAAVPQKDLAGYLGVTPVGLNRIVRRVREASGG